MRWISISLILLLAFSASAEVWIQTDWSGGPWRRFDSDSNSFLFEESINWWDVPGEIRLSNSRLDFQCPYMDIPVVNCLFTSSKGNIFAGTVGVWGYYGHGIFLNDIADSTGWSWIPDPFEPAVGIYSITEWNGDFYAGCWLRYDQHTAGGAIFRSTDGGWNWFQVGEIFTSEFSARIFASQNALWMVGRSVFRKSSDGEIWEFVDFPGTINYLREAPLLEYPPGLWVAASDGIYITADEGSSWDCVFDRGTSCPCPPVEIQGKMYILSDSGIYRTKEDWHEWEFFATTPDSFSGWIEGDGENLYLIDDHYCDSPQSGKVYRYIDQDWQLIAWLSSWFQELKCFTSDLEGNIYLSGIAEPHPDRPGLPGAHIAKILKDGEEIDQGFLISDAFYRSSPAHWGMIEWDGQGIEVQVRTWTWNDYAWRLPWSECDFVENGSDISEANSVFDEDSVIQYRITLRRDTSCDDPFCKSISLEYYTTDVQEEEILDPLIIEPKLFQNQPNPFRQSTVISYQLSAPTEVSLEIYDATGRIIRILLEKHQDAGYYQAYWNGRDSEGKQVSAGIYFYRFETENFITTRKMIVVK